MVRQDYIEQFSIDPEKQPGAAVRGIWSWSEDKDIVCFYIWRRRKESKAERMEDKENVPDMEKRISKHHQLPVQTDEIWKNSRL